MELFTTQFEIFHGRNHVTPTKTVRTTFAAGIKLCPQA